MSGSVGGRKRRGGRFTPSSGRRLREGEVPRFGVVTFQNAQGEEFVIDGEEGRRLRDLMRSQCPICAAGEEHQD